MIGDLLNTNKRREVKTRADQVMFCGKKYRQDKKTRVLCLYEWTDESACMWLCGKVRQAGTARHGCVIHHVDWNKEHNEISNLVCVTVSEHERIHNTPGGREFGEKLKKERGVGTPPGWEGLVSRFKTCGKCI